MTRHLAVLAFLSLLSLPLGADSPEEEDALKVRQLVVQKSVAWLGTPYAYGGAGSQGMDCSGMVYRVFLDVTGQSLPRNVADLFMEGTEAQEPYLPGDLLFFDTTGGPSHVGISLGDDRFVHAASQGPLTGVIVSTLEERYYRSRLIGARRIIHRRPLVVRFDLESPPQMRALTVVMTPGMPVRFALAGRAPRERQLYLKIFSAEGEVVARLLTLDEQMEASFLWFIPASGDWLVQAVGIQGTDLGSLVLQPEEGPAGKDP